MSLIIKNCYIQLEGQTSKKSDIQVEDGIITSIESGITPEVEDQVIQAQGYYVSPGFVDVHVHLREPGGEHKETIRTGTEAAARGGYTTIAAMPNTDPVPDNRTVLKTIHDKIKQDAKVNVLTYGSITKGLKGEELVDFESLVEEGIFAFTDDGAGIQKASDMLDAMTQARKLNKAIVAHCEDNSLINGGSVHLGEVSERLNINGIPSVCEAVQIARDVLLAEATGCHYHVCHVSTKESVRVIRDAKKAGIHVTAEVTPHHLLLNETDISNKDPQFKMNPPLRSIEDQKALLEGLRDGTIDFIATDHAPHSRSEKALEMEEAPFGIVGLETAFGLLYTHLVLKGFCDIEMLIDWLSVKPAKVFSLDKGTLKVGEAADIVLLDLDKEWTIKPEEFASKGRNTPFQNWTVTGKPILTVANGNIVFKEDELCLEI